MSWLDRLLNLWPGDERDNGGQPDDAADREVEAEHAALMADLAAAGRPVKDEIELASLDYRAQVPLLARWLEQARQPTIKTAILQLLAPHASAPEVVEALLREYGRFALDGGYRWEIASVLYGVNDPAIGERLLALAIDPRQGRA